MDSTQSTDKLPITFGSLLDFPANPLAVMRRLHKQHGDIAALQDGDQRIVFVFSPQYNKQVLSDSKTYHSQFFALRGGKRSAQRRVTSGLLTMNGDEHKQDRRMVMGPFQRKVLPAYHDTICELTEELLSSWTQLNVCDLAAEMTQYMLRVTSALLFGVDDGEFACQIGEQIDKWVHMNHTAGIGAFVADESFTKHYGELLEMAERLEVDVLRMIKLRRDSDRPPTDVLALLMQAADDDAVTQERLLGHITLLFGAAHLTTAHTLAWTLFLLAQHPDVMQRLYDELTHDIVGDTPTHDEISRLPYLDQVIRESMRILPASSYSQRVNPQPAQLGPLKLSPGTPIVFSQFMTHHRPDLFPNPDVFDPDRWETISPSAYEFLPFGAGPRMCPGAPLAMVELRVALTMILKRHALTLVPGSEINGKIISTMLSPTSEVPMRIESPGGPYHFSPVSGNVHEMVDLSHIPPGLRRAA
jgi:cytochrome P450